MVGLVIVCHGNLGAELINVAEGIVGKIDGAVPVSIGSVFDVDSAREEVGAAIKKVYGPEGVLILTDMFGGTPSNISLSFLEEGKVEVVTGTNLPMLIKLVTYRQGRPLSELASFIASYGKKNIYLATDVLNVKKAD